MTPRVTSNMLFLVLWFIETVTDVHYFPPCVAALELSQLLFLKASTVAITLASTKYTSTGAYVIDTTTKNLRHTCQETKEHRNYAQYLNGSVLFAEDGR
eukprot:5092173-Amphidinium_carterae.1